MVFAKLSALGILAFSVSACASAPQSASNKPSAPKWIPFAEGAAVPIAAQKKDDYKLVWADEFDKAGPLNPKDWGYERGFVRNDEQQWYQPENATCLGGKLVITAKREEKPNPNFDAGSDSWKTNREKIEYTAASVTTSGKHTWLYGRFEIKAKIDTRLGSWPAWWMLGEDMPWPSNGEIDIMEYYRSMLLANLCWQGDKKVEWNSQHKMMDTFPKDWAEKFHVWRMDWDADFVRLYCDDKLMNEQDLSETINQGKYAGKNPYHQPAYMILNQAIGGQNGGDPSKTEFPMKFQVEYVRVYQKPSQIAATQAATRP